MILMHGLNLKEKNKINEFCIVSFQNGELIEVDTNNKKVLDWDENKRVNMNETVIVIGMFGSVMIGIQVFLYQKINTICERLAKLESKS